MIHFARAWRPSQFEDVVGQELAVSLLKNSLYRGRLFPVYLLAGQRGCGKTTLARIFAAAVNCAQLAAFRERPHEVKIPCATCESCRAMQAGSHPDFHEIDAASHTGVDHVRHIIETTLLMPQLGAKKVYLIDEAHMLSRAAFNALLKTLEEPVDTALFLLATTDVHKIIDTVKSRCFQLFLKPITTTTMVHYLAAQCDAQQIAYDRAGLAEIVDGAEGSLRDAINRLERILLAQGSIVAAGTGSGRWTLHESAALVAALLEEDGAQALSMLRSDAAVATGVSEVWRMVVEYLRMLLLVQHGVTVDTGTLDQERLHAMSKQLSRAELIAMIEYLFALEQLIIKTAYPDILFEAAIAHLATAEGRRARSVPPASVPPSSKITAPVQPRQQSAVAQQTKTAGEPQKRVPVEEPPRPAVVLQAPEPDALWDQFCAGLTDPLHGTIVRQGERAMTRGAGTLQITLGLPTSLHLFRDIAEGAKESWQKELAQLYGCTVTLHIALSETTAAPARTTVRARPQLQQPVTKPARSRTPKQVVAPDETTKKVLDFFPGTVTQLKGDAS